MALGQDCFGVGADFVGHFTGTAKRAVTADDDKVDLTALHQVPGSIIGDDVVRDALLCQFPRSEDGSL